MTYVIDSDLSGGLSNAADNVPTAEAAQFLYDGIYEFDEGLTPVADLATDLATISRGRPDLDGHAQAGRQVPRRDRPDGRRRRPDLRAGPEPQLHLQPGDLPRTPSSTRSRRSMT